MTDLVFFCVGIPYVSSYVAFTRIIVRLASAACSSCQDSFLCRPWFCHDLEFKICLWAVVHVLPSRAGKLSRCEVSLTASMCRYHIGQTFDRALHADLALNNLLSERIRMSAYIGLSVSVVWPFRPRGVSFV